MHVEGAQRVFVVSGREDHRHRPTEELEHLEPVELRHLDVEKDQVRRQFGHRFHGIEPVAALGDNRDARMRTQKFTHHGARQRLVVHDDDAKEFGFGHAGSVAFTTSLARRSTGNDSSIRQTPPCSLLLTIASAP